MCLCGTSCNRTTRPWATREGTGDGVSCVLPTGRGGALARTGFAWVEVLCVQVPCVQHIQPSHVAQIRHFADDFRAVVVVHLMQLGQMLAQRQVHLGQRKRWGGTATACQRWRVSDGECRPPPAAPHRQRSRHSHPTRTSSLNMRSSRYLFPLSRSALGMMCSSINFTAASK